MFKGHGWLGSVGYNACTAQVKMIPMERID